MILTFVEGPIENNNYLVFDEKTHNAFLVDCTCQSDVIDKAIDENSLNLKYILLTHGHFDHVLGVNYYREKYRAKSFMHKDDMIIAQTVKEYLKQFGQSGEFENPIIDNYFDDEFDFDGEKIKVLHTPGHTQGSVCLLYKDILFSGDTLFFESCGRTDLPTGSFENIKKSINELFKLDDDIIVLSGHGAKTSIGHEKKYNTIVRGF